MNQRAQYRLIRQHFPLVGLWAMGKKLKGPIHDHLFKEVYQGTRYALDIFRLVLTKREFQLFNWKTLRSELTDYID
ncbi:MAG: hypothetical protein OXB88_00050, partial [Bacteriovoracales bacterium]|nr:hypothetical protein [Bacteriovoracales bacterium]